MSRTSPLIVALALSLISVGVRAQVINFPTVILDGSQEVPSNASPSTGTASVTLDLGTGQLGWNLSFSPLSAAQTAAHFHVGAVGVNGPVVVNIGVGNPAVGSAPLTPAQRADLLAGRFYINVHSVAIPSGEIRGQVHPPASFYTLAAVPLNSAEQVPTNSSTATGVANLTIDTATGRVFWTLAYTGLSSTQTAAHFHVAPVGVNGPVAVGIGVGNPIAGSAVLNASAYSSLVDDGVYINVHTMSFPGGEIRGQVILPQAAITTVGTGCGGRSLTTFGPPEIGNLGFGLHVVGATPGESLFLFLATGTTTSPLSLGGGCLVYLDASALGLLSAGLSPLGPFPVSGVFNLPLPLATPGAAGLSLAVQGILTSGGGLTSTNALEVTIGF